MLWELVCISCLYFNLLDRLGLGGIVDFRLKQAILAGRCEKRLHGECLLTL